MSGDHTTHGETMCTDFNMWRSSLLGISSYYFRISLELQGTWRPLTQTESTIIPNHNIDSYVVIVVKPITLVLEIFCITCIRVAKDHCSILPVLPGLLLFFLIAPLLFPELLLICGPARHPVAVKPRLVSRSEKDLLRLKLQFHLNAHLLE